MQITFKVRGFYDWEEADKHPGVQITKADVKGLRAKLLMNDKWSIRVERDEAYLKSTTGQPLTEHHVNIPELQIINYMTHQALVGYEPTREDAACHLLRQSNRHHIARKHIVSVSVADEGPNAELLESEMKLHIGRHTQEDFDRLGVDPAKVADEIRERYLQENDAKVYIAAQFGPLPTSTKKGA